MLYIDKLHCHGNKQYVLHLYVVCRLMQNFTLISGIIKSFRSCPVLEDVTVFMCVVEIVRCSVSHRGSLRDWTKGGNSNCIISLLYCVCRGIFEVCIVCVGGYLRCVLCV
jgi:hypothetical protein